MKHLGDITKINGSTVKPVNVIIGGSPRQDLSVAGKRAGLAGERSGLFMEQIRVIKEMRCADAERGRTGSDIRPRWMVWENVPGAFSSNKGEDFGAVLHETIKVVCPQAPPVPVPKYGWPPVGCLTDLGGKWSLAWRVFDAQFWGVPQRRKRISLVCDFGGLTAPEILFERKGVPGYSPPSGAPWQTFTRSIAESAGEKSCVIPINDKATRYNGGGGSSRNNDGAGNGLGIGTDEDPSPTLTAGDRHAVFLSGGKPPPGLPCETVGQRHSPDTQRKDGHGGGQCPSNSKVSACLRMRAGCAGGGKGALIQIEKSGTLCPNNDQVLFTMQGFGDYIAGGGYHQP